MKKNVKFYAHFNCWQRFVYNGERRSLSGQHTAEANQDRNEPHDLGEIHRGSFDFTLSTA
jgi:hypothetical protein